LTYMKLSVWPAPLIFDYGFPPPAPPAWQLVTGVIALTAVAVASGLAIPRHPLAGVVGISFFLVLAPTSSVIPILTEVIAEHRMYLPLACVLGVVVGGVAATGRFAVRRGWLTGTVVRAVAWALLLAAAAGLEVLTWQRNAIYRTETALWLDTASKVPGNPRAQNNLGMAYLEAGDTRAALERFHLAVTTLPNYFEANANMSVALERLGRPGEALAYIRRAVDLNPTSLPVHTALVRILARLGRWDEALAAAKVYVDQFPDSSGANALYASLLASRGQLGEAQRYQRKAQELDFRK
jgi:protein O-mannosyl-transferase